MVKKYTGDNYTPHFEGLWAPVDSAHSEGERRLAMLFLGECYVVFFEFLLSTRAFNYSSHTYLLEDDQMLMMSMDSEKSDDNDDEDFDTLRWDITNDGLLELEEDGQKSLWEPVLVEDLADEGFPVAAIQGYRKAYAQNGISHSIVGVAPLPSTMQAIKKLKGSQSKE